MSLPRIPIHFGKGRDRQDLSIKQAGQILVIFALMLTALIGLVGIAIDVTFAWRNGLQIQRAADAAAMAGVVYLPGNLSGTAPSATSTATTIATDNGYSTGLTIAKNPADDHQLDVTITAQVPTFFVRLFGINNWTITRKARAAYIMPVPMGSPLNYYGIGCLVTQGVTPPACNTPATSTGNSGVAKVGAQSFNALGAWGAVITYGGNAENGDAYSPFYNRKYTNPNPAYDPHGYYYAVSVPAGISSTVHLYDPGFCEMGQYQIPGSSPAKYNQYGTGDHWIAADAGTSNYSNVSTLYNLIDTHGQPLNPSAWEVIATSDDTFNDQHGQDAANAGTQTRHGSGACDSYHDNWGYTLGGSLAGGADGKVYEVQVTTTIAGKNLTTNAENMFGIMATGTGVQIYGQSRMAQYNNLAGTASGTTTQRFYMAKVDQSSGIGKTLQISLFDIGDSTAGSISIISPNGPGGSQQQATFSYTTSSDCKPGVSDACQDPSTTSIVVAGPSGSSFNSTWIYISVDLGGSYGSAGLWGPTGNGLPATDPNAGWWQIQYKVQGGNDTTTWGVNVLGNPVHLVPIG